MALKLITAPAAEPISTADARTHCRVDDTTDNSYLDALVAAAREHCEMFTGRALISQTWDLYLDRFPCGDYFGDVGRYRDAAAIRLPKPPAVSITSVVYYDTSGTLQTMDASLYSLDTASEPARLTPVYGSVWPATQDIPNAVKIRFVCGYGAAGSAVPASIIHAMKLLVGHWYENREQVATGTIATNLPMAVEALLWGNRVLEIV